MVAFGVAFEDFIGVGVAFETIGGTEIEPVETIGDIGIAPVETVRGTETRLATTAVDSIVDSFEIQFSRITDLFQKLPSTKLSLVSKISSFQLFS